MNNEDRVISFSIKPDDIKGKDEIQKLKQHCKKTGISFSFLVLQAIAKQNRTMKI